MSLKDDVTLRASLFKVRVALLPLTQFTTQWRTGVSNTAVIGMKISQFDRVPISIGQYLPILQNRP